MEILHQMKVYTKPSLIAGGRVVTVDVTKYQVSDNILTIDLTATFGAGNEPTADQVDALLQQDWNMVDVIEQIVKDDE